MQFKNKMALVKFMCIYLVINLRIIQSMDPLIKDLLTPLPQLGEKCGYESCPAVKEGWINVHIVPHSHAELGLSKSFADYYSGESYGGWMKIRINWKQILDATITELWVIKDRKFTISDSELPYFFHWWARRDGTVRRMVYELIRQGRLVFVGGGWGMPDEASTAYQSIIDSYTYSLRKINATFLWCGRPLVGWQADTFGHSREYASLVAQMGFDGLFVNPISFDDELIRMERRALEFVWRGSDDLGPETDIYTHKLFDGYWSPPGFCFGSTCSDPLLLVSDSLFSNFNLRIEQFITQIRYRQSPHYNTRQVMVVMGQRHGYFDAKIWFNNIDTLIQKFNERTYENDEKMHAMYSTPACYLKAVYEDNPILETKQDDFFPYAYKKNTYTTGMYTTRPAFKYLVRESNIFLQMAKQLHVLINLGNYDKMFENFNWIMGVVQDHNIISGAMRDHVASYYVEKLHSAVQWSTELLQDAFNKIRKAPTNTEYRLCYLNISSCPNTKLDRFHVTIYNPLAWPVTMPVRLPIRNIKYVVFDPSGVKIKAVKMPIPDHVFDIPNRKIPVVNELVFIAENIPPLGLRSYFMQRETRRVKRSIIKKMGKNQQKKYYIRQLGKENRPHSHNERSHDYDDFEKTKSATKIEFRGDKFEEINDYDSITPRYNSDVESSVKDFEDSQFNNIEIESPAKNFDQYDMRPLNNATDRTYDEYGNMDNDTEFTTTKFADIQMKIKNGSTVQNNDEYENFPYVDESLNKTLDPFKNNNDQHYDKLSNKTLKQEFTTDKNVLDIKNDDELENVRDIDKSKNSIMDEIKMKNDNEARNLNVIQIPAVNNEQIIKPYEVMELSNVDKDSTNNTFDENEKAVNNNEIIIQNAEENEVANVDSKSNMETFHSIKMAESKNETGPSGDENDTINVERVSNMQTFHAINMAESKTESSWHIGDESDINVENDTNMRSESIGQVVDESDRMNMDKESNMQTFHEIKMVESKNELPGQSGNENDTINVGSESNMQTFHAIEMPESKTVSTGQVDNESEINIIENETNIKNEITGQVADENDLINVDNESNMQTFHEIKMVESKNESTGQIGDESINNAESELKTFHETKITGGKNVIHSQITNIDKESNNKYDVDITTEISEQLNSHVLKSTTEKFIYIDNPSDQSLTASLADIHKPKFKAWVPEVVQEKIKDSHLFDELNSDDYYARESKDNFIRNQYIQINLDEYRKISGMSMSNGVNTSLDIQYYYYISDEPTDNSTRKPGAYIFRSVDTKPEPVIDFIETKVFKSDVVQEIHTKYSKYASLAVKLYTNNPVIEIDWVIGPIPIEDNFGKEVFIRYTTDLENEGVFYTDANCRQTIKRIRHLRPMYEPYDLDPIAGNFYPVTSRIYIEDAKKNLRFSIFNDRSQGGSSLIDGSIDLMVHRRILTDTTGSFIIINETEYGKGLMVRGNHYLYLTKANHRQNRVYEKKIAKEIELKPQVTFNRIKQDISRDIWLDYNNEFTSINKKLPIGIHILTLQEWNGRTILLRLENYLEKIDTVKHGVKKVNIKDLFVNIKVLDLTEMNLAANMLITDNVKLNWRINGSFVKNFNDFYGSTDKIGYSNDESKIGEDVNIDKGIILVPQQIRTFVIQYEYIKL